MRIKFLICTLVLLAGCATSPGSKSVENSSAGTLIQKRNVSENEAQVAIDRLLTGSLNDDEIDKYFLFAEYFLSQNSVINAEKCYAAIYEKKPTLVIGMKLAKLYSISGKHEEAENVVNKMRLLFPKNIEPVLAFSFVMEFKGKINAAISVVEDGFVLNPNSEDLLIRLVELLINANKVQEAKVKIEKYLVNNPQSSWSYIKLGQIFVDEKKFVEAKKYVDKLLKIFPDSIEGLTIAGHIAQQQGNFVLAEKYFRAAFEKQPDNDLLAQYYVHQLLQQKRYEEARRLLLKLETNSTPESNKSFENGISYQLGIVLLELEEYAEAKKRFQDIATRIPDAGVAFYLIGQCEEGLKDFVSALENYNKLTIDSEFYKNAQQRLVIINLELNKIEEANIILTNISNSITKKDTLETYRFVGLLYSRIKEYKKANEILNKGVNIYKNSPELLYSIAANKEYLISKEASIADLEKLIKLYPNYAPAINHLAYTLAILNKKLDYALQLSKKTLTLEPLNGGYLDTQGWIYFQLKQPQMALTVLKKAISLDKDEPVIYEHLGEVYLSIGDEQAALTNFETAFQLFNKNSLWKVEFDPEWKESKLNVQKRVDELKAKLSKN